MIATGVSPPSPAANGCPRGWLWHAAQCPAAESTSPVATESAENLAGAGGAIRAIAGRHARTKNPSSPTTAAARIAIKTRRVKNSDFITARWTPIGRVKSENQARAAKVPQRQQLVGVLCSAYFIS